jgi:hypothetical protein
MIKEYKVPCYEKAVAAKYIAYLLESVKEAHGEACIMRIVTVFESHLQNPWLLAQYPKFREAALEKIREFETHEALDKHPTEGALLRLVMGKVKALAEACAACT